MIADKTEKLKGILERLNAGEDTEKVRLNELASNVDEMDFQLFQRELRKISEPLIIILRDHIYKENNILYPTAKQLLKAEKWIR